MTTEHSLSRRDVINGAMGCGVLALLAACGSGDSPTTTKTAPKPEAGAPEGALVKASDVPVGGGVIADETTLVTQPTSGEFRGFTTVCPHQQGVVSPNGKVLECARHHSQFDPADGGVLQGPAEMPLPQVTVSVVDGWVVMV